MMANKCQNMYETIYVVVVVVAAAAAETAAVLVVVAMLVVVMVVVLTVLNMQSIKTANKWYTHVSQYVNMNM
jgi:hypothetical protein